MNQRDSYSRQRRAKEQTKWIEQDKQIRRSASEPLQKEWREHLEQAGLLHDPVCAAEVVKAFQLFSQRPAPEGWEVESIRWELLNVSDQNDKLLASLTWNLQQETLPPPWDSAPYHRRISLDATLIFEPVNDALRGVDEHRWEPSENMPWLWQPHPLELEELTELFWIDLIIKVPGLIECLARDCWQWKHEKLGLISGGVYHIFTPQGIPDSAAETLAIYLEQTEL